MPRFFRRRRFSNRRRFFRRRRFRSRRGLTSTVARLNRQVSTIVRGVEKKVIINANSGIVSTTPAVVHLTGIGQGDTQQNREGNKIMVRSLWMSGSVQIHASAAHSQLRFVLVQDNQQVGDASPAFTDVFDIASVDSGLNNDNLGRFKILWDRTFNVSQNGNQIRSFKMGRRMRHVVRYNGTAGTDIQKGGLYLMSVSTEATNTPTLTHNLQMRFTDN